MTAAENAYDLAPEEEPVRSQAGRRWHRKASMADPAAPEPQPTEPPEPGPSAGRLDGQPGMTWSGLALTWPDEQEARLAMVAYLSVPFFGFVVPLVVYLRALRRSTWLRAHAAQALNVWVTVLLYDVSIAVMGAMLALDNLDVAIYVAVPVLVALWVTTLVVLVRAAVTASHGEEYAVPRWLCTRLAR